MKLIIQKEMEPEILLNLDMFMQNDYTSSGAKGYLGICYEEGMCAVWVDWGNNANRPTQPTLRAAIAPVGAVPQGSQCAGQYAFRIHKDRLQFFNGWWQDFHQSAQDQYHMQKADGILLGDNDETDRVK